MCWFWYGWGVGGDCCVCLNITNIGRLAGLAGVGWCVGGVGYGEGGFLVVS